VGPPTGTVTFLFTDIVGSTRLWESQPVAMQSALARHDALLRDAVEAHGGAVVKTTGDGAMAVFALPADAVRGATATQHAFATEAWPAEAVIASRMAVHSGAAEARDGDYYGTAANRSARLMAIAHGGQILVSDAAAALVRDDDDIVLRDLGEHRLRDLSRPERVHQVVAPELRDDFPPLRSLDFLPTNLPVQLTTFVGRDHEIARLRKAVEAHRLVTVTGVGGVGKTRIAMQVGADVIGQFTDGVWLTELAAALDADAMASVVAAAFSIEPRGGMSLSDSIVEALRARQLLWIVDNCEHLVEPAARLVDRVLRAAPGVSVLATSREGLDVEGEHITALRSLGTSDIDSVEAIADSDAVRLFVDRATAVRPSFQVDAANARALNELCRRLDGIPLAIELAASRTASLGVDEILALLDERFRLLTGGRRVALERHQTLRATVDWSYSLLTDDERVVFARLATFTGSFDSRAVRAVVADETLDAWTVLDALDGLVRKSMVTPDEQADGAVRYQLLETMRQYAREHLDETGEGDACRRRHLDHFVTVAIEITDALMTADEMAARVRLSTELDNIRAACIWALDIGDAHALLQIVMALDEERWIGNAPIGLPANQALALKDLLAPDEQQELMIAAIVERYRGEQTGLSEMLDEAYAIQPDATRWSFRVLRTMALPGIASLEQMQRMLDGMDAFVPDPAASARDATAQSWTVMNGSLAAVNLGNIPRAIELADLALGLARRGGSPSSIARANMELGMSLASVDPDRARICFQECIDFGRRGVRFTGLGSAHMQAALIDAHRGDHHGAAVLLRGAFDALLQAGRTAELDGAFGYTVEIFERLGETEAALVIVGSILHGALRVLRDYPAPPSRQPADVRAMRERVGTDRFAALVNQGTRMSYAELLEFVQANLDRIIAATEPQPAWRTRR
jgi:predicted ATPase/class 3 adenylate cyclase